MKMKIGLLPLGTIHSPVWIIEFITGEDGRLRKIVNGCDNKKKQFAGKKNDDYQKKDFPYFTNNCGSGFRHICKGSVTESEASNVQ